jgi:glycerol-3-phosphate dehydrogenase (NAD(P)+)
MLFTALLTAYYSFRLYFRVFEGPEVIPAPRADHGGATHDDHGEDIDEHLTVQAIHDHSTARTHHPAAAHPAGVCAAGAGARPTAAFGSLSGRNLGVEIARGVPTATVVASADQAFAEDVRDRFMCRTFRVYTSSDVTGVELGGALKNVLAIGAGVSDGLGFGDNTKGAFIARGLHEMCSLGAALGARRETFMGLSGVGDLFATAVSRLSRNYRVGFSLGQGASLDSALAELGQVAEGVPTASAAVALAQRNGVDVPVMESVHRVLAGEITPLEGVSMLMERTAKTEN